MIDYPCQDCDCGPGQGRNCKLRPPRQPMSPYAVRYILLLFCCLIAMLCGAVLSGCDSSGGSMYSVKAEDRGSSFLVYTNPLTGCQYLKPVGYDGLAPRLGRDRKQICRDLRK